jgi:anaerobic magnesium-protoporphyrin IX monomethyl ester cyclase
VESTGQARAGSCGRKPVRRVLLVFPATRIHREGVKQAMPPMGAAYLAAAIRDLVHVAILDAVAEGFHRERPSTSGFYVYGLTVPEMVGRARAFEPDLVGITCLYSANFPVVADLCRELKRAMPHVVTVVGGTHPTFLAERCLAEAPDIDIIALGEGELTLRDLVEGLPAGRDLATIDGIAYRDPASGALRVNPKTRWIEDLDSLPLPARDLLPMSRYHEIGVPHLIVSQRRRFATVFTSRGCPARCTFCSSWRFWGGRYRVRSAGNVLAELETLKRDFGVEDVHFEDDALNLNRERFRLILEGMIDRGMGLAWCVPNGIALWALSPELVRLMRRSGCYEVTLAFESGCQRVLDEIVHKPLRLDRVRPLLEEMRREGIRTSSFFIVGFPGETLAEMRETFALPRRLGLDYAWFWIANPLPGTHLHEICETEGYLEPGFDFAQNSFSKCHLRTPEWTPAQVERLAHLEFLKFNLVNLARHPRSLFQRYRGFIRDPRLVREIMRGLLLRSAHAAGLGRLWTGVAGADRGTTP